MKVREKSKRKKSRREKDFIVDGDYKSILWILVNLPPFSLEGILYLYKPYQIDKVKESCSVWIPKSIIWLRIELNAPVRIDVEESLFLSGGSRSTANKDELPPGVATLFELILDLIIEISVIRSDSYVNHPTRSQFKLDDGSELTVSEATTHHTLARGWIDTCHDLRRVRKWPLQMPPLLPSLGRVRELTLGDFRFPGSPM